MVGGGRTGRGEEEVDSVADGRREREVPGASACMVKALEQLAPVATSTQEGTTGRRGREPPADEAGAPKKSTNGEDLTPSNPTAEGADRTRKEEDKRLARRLLRSGWEGLGSGIVASAFGTTVTKECQPRKDEESGDGS
jgi:hypothetical protein